MRCVAAFIAAIGLGSCATLPLSAEPPSPTPSQVASEAGPIYFVRAPTSDPNVFALKLAETDPTQGYERVAWHPLAGARSDTVFVSPNAPVSGSDIVGTSVVYPCDLGLGSPGYGVWVFFLPSSHARVRKFSGERRDGLVAVLVEGKAIMVARMRGEISNRMQICPDSASREEATRLARVLAGE